MTTSKLIDAEGLGAVWFPLQVKLQHLVTIHVRSSAFGSKEDAGMFMKGLAVQYDVWAETHYQRMLSVSGPVDDIHLYALCQAAFCMTSDLPTNMDDEQFAQDNSLTHTVTRFAKVLLVWYIRHLVVTCHR